ncbi:anthranilate phosphoribosyltransferase [Streptomyces flavidovirens]|uniref:anthranilate phosphoribosyltransferase n=1 Tax=Streptomyces flavidovirens TaxID=67298 RepID=UPI0003FEF62D|nr:anthranilate phosphoribosyltransferase [Streptomyces flavidovirens]
MKTALRTLAEGGRLTREQAGRAMAAVLGGQATPGQIAGFAMALSARRADIEEIVGLVATARAFGARLTGDGRVLDTCGTGGDGHDTFNISTTAAVVAAACGVPVAKHGNRSASSTCGSADVLEALGVRIDLGPAEAAACLAEVGITFLFAPVFQPAFRYAAGPRRELGVRTVFNVLGPLCNPAGARYQTLGVSDPALLEVMAEVLHRLGTERALVFCADDGLDELSTCSPSRVVELTDGSTTSYRLDPADLGLARATLADLRGGDAAANAETVRRILAGEPGPRRDIVLLNTAAALRAAGQCEDWQAGIARAAEAIDSGHAAAVLDRWVAAGARPAAQAAA